MNLLQQGLNWPVSTNLWKAWLIQVISFHYSKIMYAVSGIPKYPSHVQHLTVILPLFCKKGTTQKI